MSRWAIIQGALVHAPTSCRYHGTDWNALGFAHGEPRCESCRRPWRVSRALDALDDLVREDMRQPVQQSHQGLMSVGLHFDDADPVATCLVPGCRWHGHGDAIVDALNAWAKHLTTLHREDWPAEQPERSDHDGPA